MSSEDRYRVAWHYKEDHSRHGHGEWHRHRSTLEPWVQMGNKDWPELHHWIESEGDDDETESV